MALIGGAAKDIVNLMANDGDRRLKELDRVVEMILKSPSDCALKERMSIICLELDHKITGIIPNLELAGENRKFRHYYGNTGRVDRISWWSQSARSYALDKAHEIRQKKEKILAKIPSASR